MQQAIPALQAMRPTNYIFDAVREVRVLRAISTHLQGKNCVVSAQRLLAQYLWIKNNGVIFALRKLKRFNTYKMMYNRGFTPDRISELKPDEIFVFGSNLSGFHGGGAARVACDRFGAVWGQGVGLQGQCYAIPTMQGGVETIAPYVDEFIDFAGRHPQYKFLVTRIGCGIAGFRDEEIAPLFHRAIDVENVILPREFVEVILSTGSE